MSLAYKCGTAPSCPPACLHSNAYHASQFNSALSALAMLNAPMQTKASHDSQQKCQQHTSSQSRCNSQSTLLPCSLDFEGTPCQLIALDGRMVTLTSTPTMTKLAESIGWYVGVCNKFPLVDALEWFLHQRERREHCVRIACNI